MISMVAFKPLIAGILIALIFFSSLYYSITLADWFDWKRNALSDLGNSVKSLVAAQFNFGLLLVGLLMILLALNYVRRSSRVSWILFAISGFFLQTVATFDEVYGQLHFLVSVAVFTSMGLTILADSIEFRSKAMLGIFILYALIWPSYFFIKTYTGILTKAALAEISSVILFMAYFILRCIKAPR
ncbi:MAG: DUF998 domain-containing protein [Thaumarchaeota archaeon]|nr:DUF998 domain-containing protein [Nitrososphaerota archaeon]